MSSTAMDEPLVNAAELARRLGLHRNTIRDMAQDGRIPYIRISSRCLRYRVSDVMKALEARK